MMRHVTHILIAVIWLGIAAGCRSTRSPENNPGAGDTGNALDDSNPSVTPASQWRPGRGLGRNMAAPPGGRGRNRAIRLTAEEVESLGIATVRAGYQSVIPSHSAMGRVLAPPSRMAKVSYAFPARISAIHARIGDWVEKGQAVLTIQSEEVGRAKTEYYKATADLELARQNHEREKRLAARGVGAQKNAVASEAGLKVAAANLEAAEKKLHVLGFSESEVQAVAATHQINPEITLFAPIRGRVIEHNAVLGGMIDQTTDLMTLMDPTLLWVDAEIFERDIAKIRLGQDAQVSVLAYPGEVFRGRISYIGETMNQETRTINVRTEVQNNDLKLKHGMFADVTVILNGGQKLLTVPAEAILDDRDAKIVFIKGNGEYVARTVEVGAKQDSHYAIDLGIEEGEEVVVKGAFMLKSKLYDELLKKAHIH